MRRNRRKRQKCCYRKGRLKDRLRTPKENKEELIKKQVTQDESWENEQFRRHNR
jgi:hypothetical protein